MSFNVRIFGHRGTRQLQQVIPNQFTSQISEVLVQPYEWSQVITTNGAIAVSSAAVASPDLATLVMIEIPDGQQIRYEFNTSGRTPVSAGNASPRAAGVNLFFWSPGTIISVVEAANYL